MNYIDISPIISSQTAVYPGDPEFKRDIILDFKKGDNTLLSSIFTTLHIGSHADSFNHCSADGIGISDMPLDFYIGKCQVISLNLLAKERIYPENIKNIPIKASRIIFKTNSFPDCNNWNDDYNSLTPELIDYLAEKEVILVGIDTPSIDPINSVELETHKSTYKNKMAIIEGLVLNQVTDDVYTLIALPLKIKDADASPIRAILLKDIFL